MYSKPPGFEAALARDREQADKKAREAAAAAAAAAAEGGNAAGSSQQQQQALEKLPPGQQQQQQKQLQQRQQQDAAAEAAMRQRQMDMDKLREDPFAAILAARSALQSSEKFVLKSVEGAYGGTLPDAGNQMLLGGDDDDDVEQKHQQHAAAAAEVDGESQVLLALTRQQGGSQTCVTWGRC